jgi:hypothetical protein
MARVGAATAEQSRRIGRGADLVRLALGAGAVGCGERFPERR